MSIIWKSKMPLIYALCEQIMKIILILLLVVISIGHNIYAAECIYLPKQTPENPYPELSTQGQCGQLIEQDTFQLNKSHLNKLYFSNNGLASIIYGDAIFYVSKTGKVVRTYFYDNGADYFVEGVARTILDGKFGYIDQQLNIVIMPEYDFAFPFINGIAIVCNDCRSESDGEHKVMLGGRWGLINKVGMLILPLNFSKKELLESSEYKRITKH